MKAPQAGRWQDTSRHPVLSAPQSILFGVLAAGAIACATSRPQQQPVAPYQEQFAERCRRGIGNVGEKGFQYWDEVLERHEQQNAQQPELTESNRAACLRMMARQKSLACPWEQARLDQLVERISRWTILSQPPPHTPTVRQRTDSRASSETTAVEPQRRPVRVPHLPYSNLACLQQCKSDADDCFEANYGNPPSMEECYAEGRQCLAHCQRH